ncbi:hypothetical protein C1X59_19405 [Pseudomonas sp. FW215-R2]|uniref:hypothetical protein n=1 Tax=unclassified Pseudomonas TaxID=196821 RepID=UPI000C88EEDA|nr:MULTISPECIES: hypothetical protein [unclassified Pseudomonas]PMW98558.1 hypothetical protein C1X59_19405 [Pseudomonas sp. FW215-R2]PMX07676.1 hypothetical protein C1X60_20405 [Pseudomonas sp. FW215-L1]PMX23531.1 hypothetical protein C1X57_11405 [Pseudomonas sp. FW215-E1]PNA30910.1 hypothetical protein C1X58_08485 [Pseudomonas sp. FW215-R4]
MNRTIAALMLGSLLSATAPLAMAGSTVPPTGIPGVNQGGTESKEEKADKKGEEASGSNSGAESHETEKGAQTSSGSKDGVEEKKP